MSYRTLGRTGERVSAIGLGGHHIGRIREEQESIKVIRSAIDRGINFMDNGIDTMQLLEQALEAARTFKPMDRAQVATMMNRTREAAAKGQYELYKTTNQFDSTAMNPSWLG